MIKHYVVYAFACVLFCCIISSVKADYNDVRCKCICPSKTVVEEEENDRRVYISRMDDPAQCTCQNVVNPINEKDFCPRCECKWQRRNTTTIKVVVIIIVCIVSLLFLYMLFLLCLDPLMSRRPRTYQEQHNEEDDHGIGRGVLDAESPSTSHDAAAARNRSGSIINKVKGQVSKVRGEQEKWKGTVMEQRKNIYDRRTMLN